MTNGEHQREKDIYRLRIIEWEIIPALKKLDMTHSLERYREECKSLRAELGMTEEGVP